MLSAEETEAIQKVIDGIGDAWNRNDMPAYASFLTEDCGWINIVGMHWRGKPAVMKAHEAYHATMFKGVQQHVLESEITEIAPGVAHVVLTIKMDDFTTPDGRLEQNMHDRMSWVLLRQPNAIWLIRAAHNTTINPLAAQHDPAK